MIHSGTGRHLEAPARTAVRSYPPAVAGPNDTENNVTENHPTPIPATGESVRRRSMDRRERAIALVQAYLDAVPSGEAEDARLWRAVEMALDAAGLPPADRPRPVVTVAQLSRERAGALLEAARDMLPVDTGRSAVPMDWPAVVAEEGTVGGIVAAAHAITAGRPIVGVPTSYEDYEREWGTDVRPFVPQPGCRNGALVLEEERVILGHDVLPIQEAAIVLGRTPGAVQKLRNRQQRGAR